MREMAVATREVKLHHCALVPGGGALLVWTPSSARLTLKRGGSTPGERREDA